MPGEVTNKYKDVSFGDAEAVFNIIGGVEGIARLKRGYLIVVERQAQIPPRRVNMAKLVALAGGSDTMSTEDIEQCLEPKWTVGENGVIYLTLPATTGRTGEEWITHFERKGDRLSDYAKSVLLSKKFQPTTGIVNQVAILPAKLWKDNERLTKRIRKDAYAGTFTKEKLTDPNAEVLCLIRDYLTDEEIEMLGLWYIVGMHKPIEDFDGDPFLLSAERRGDGCGLRAYCDDPGHQWHGGGGFAFSVPQVIVPQA
ncbi:MAG TPA: hypothetical protein P5274_00335 [Candidatus Paceibacterota bacterium]|nr:hypothetical protein [Candidatus Paceibacterota bacterium]